MSRYDGKDTGRPVPEQPGEVELGMGGELPAGCHPVLWHVTSSRAAAIPSPGERYGEQLSIVTEVSGVLLFVWF